ncbi:hypothetical protein RRG08_049175 [Elysia crispata]|uniref:Uncharacterized protein n=1 Tax=Elysia crispata TaxID=231223 RepID=A0AAE1ASE9_9GAST|nr:hypothetical protein RRG08_049175 [Elysia crispata]
MKGLLQVRLRGEKTLQHGAILGLSNPINIKVQWYIWLDRATSLQSCNGGGGEGHQPPGDVKVDRPGSNCSSPTGRVGTRLLRRCWTAKVIHSNHTGLVTVQALACWDLSRQPPSLDT